MCCRQQQRCLQNSLHSDELKCLDCIVVVSVQDRSAVAFTFEYDSVSALAFRSMSCLSWLPSFRLPLALRTNLALSNKFALAGLEVNSCNHVHSSSLDVDAVLHVQVQSSRLDAEPCQHEEQTCHAAVQRREPCAACATARRMLL